MFYFALDIQPETLTGELKCLELIEEKSKTLKLNGLGGRTTIYFVDPTLSLGLRLTPINVK